MKKKTCILIYTLSFALCLNINAQLQSQLIKVIMAADHKDWTYRVNETARFTVQVIRDGNPVDNAVIDFEAGPEALPDIRKAGMVLKNGKTEFSGTMKVPGFYQVRVWAVVDGRKYEGLATAGFEPEKIQPTVKDPADFESFWNNAITAAKKISLDPRMTLMPERCTSEANVYHISFQNDAPGSRIYGILAMPKKPGQYPAILTVPGAGIRPYQGNSAIAGRGIITLEIGIHGLPVILDPQVYTGSCNRRLVKL
jgi:cephalosporin-C deacetylase